MNATHFGNQKVIPFFLGLLFLLGLSVYGQESAIVWTQKTEVRVEPNMRAEVVCKVYQGDHLTLLEGRSANISTFNLLEGRFSAPWYEVQTADNKKGYVWGGGLKMIGGEDPDPDLPFLLDQEWSDREWNLGTVKDPEMVHTKFTFKNTGKQNFTIASAKPSCGCLTTNWSKETVGPGESGWVAISFNARGRKGHDVHKYVTVTWKEGGIARVIRVNGKVE